MVAKDKAQAAPASHDEVDLDELLDVSRSRNIYFLNSCIYLLCTAHSIMSYTHIDICQISSNFLPGSRTWEVACGENCCFEGTDLHLTLVKAYASVIFILFLNPLHATERGWEAWSAEKARSRWIQGNNWRWLPWGGYWQWKGYMSFLPPWILPLQVCQNFFLPYSFTHIQFCLLCLWKLCLQIFARIMDKHLKALAPVYVGTKFVKLDAEVCILSLFALITSL